MSYNNFDPFFDEEPDNNQNDKQLMTNNLENCENAAASAENNADAFANDVTPFAENFFANTAEPVAENFFANTTEPITENFFANTAEPVAENFFANTAEPVAENFFADSTEPVAENNADAFANDVTPFTENFFANSTEPVAENFFADSTEPVAENLVGLDVSQMENIAPLDVPQMENHVESSVNNNQTSVATSDFFGNLDANNNSNSGNNVGGGNFDYGRFNGGGDYPRKKKVVKTKNHRGIGLILAIMIPVLIITNIVTSVFVFNNVWSDAKTEFEAKLDNIISNQNNLGTGGTSMLSYNVASKEMQSVVEIYSTYASGSSAGTGFIVTTDGYILTNAHVVTYTAKSYSGIGPNGSITTNTKACEKVVVQFEGNETQYKVQVVAYDTSLDIAVLKMETPPTNLRAVKIADSTLLSFGEPCVAIGNAKGYGLAVTEGVISSPIQYYNLTTRDNALTAAVQHSAAINPGNSGGPLFNMYGLVVGINSFKLTGDTSEIAIDGMGFAIPSAVVKDYVNGLGINGLHISYTPNPVSVA